MLDLKFISYSMSKNLYTYCPVIGRCHGHVTKFANYQEAEISAAPWAFRLGKDFTFTIPGGPKKWYPGFNFAITSVNVHRF